MNDKGKLFYRLILDDSEMRRSATRVEKRLKRISTTAKREGDTIDRALRKIGKAIGGYFSIEAATRFIRKMVQVRGEIEALEVSFSTLLGSQTKAATMMEELKNFASTTPMLLGDLAKGAQTMLGFNIESERVVELLKAIGDISMGNSERFQSLVLAFSQMSSTGKLMGQDLLQMINAGFNPLMEISEKTGKSIATLKDEMAKGAISVEMVTDAFLSVTQEGGKFHGMLEKQGQTLRGSFQQLQGAFSEMLNELGEKSEDFIKGAVDATKWLVQNYQKIAKILKVLIGTYGSYKATLMLSTALEKAHHRYLVLNRAGALNLSKAFKALTVATKAQTKAMLSNPYLATAAVVVALAAGLYKLATADDAAAAAAKRHKEAREEAKNALDEYKQTVSEYLAVIRDENQPYAKRIETHKKLQEIEPAYVGLSVEDVTAMSDEVLDARTKQEAYNKELKNLLDERDELKERLKKAPTANTRGFRGWWAMVIDPFVATEHEKLTEQLILLEEDIAEKERIAKEALEAQAAANEAKAKQLKEDKKLTEEEEDAIRKARKRQNDRIEANEAYQKSLKKQAINAEFELREAKIQALEEGMEKELQLAKLQSDRLLEENRKREEKMLEELLNYRRKQWELSNPNLVEEGYRYQGSVSREDLTKAQRDQLAGYEILAQKQLQEREKEIFASRLREFESYLQERTRVEKEWQTKRSELIKAGGDEENLKELERRRTESLQAVDRTWAQKQDTYQSWLATIADFSLEKLQTELERITKLLAEAEGKDTAPDPESLARLRAGRDHLQEAIKQMKNTAPEKRTTEEWEALASVLRNVGSELDEIAQSLEGINPTIAKAVSNTASLAKPVIGAISHIARFAELSKKGISETAGVAEKAVHIAEKGTAILAVLSAALQIATRIAELFNKDRQADKRIAGILGQVDELQDKIDNLFFATDLEKSAGNPIQTLSLKLEEAQAHAIATAIALGDVQKAVKLINGEVVDASLIAKDLAKAYEQADYMAGKAVGSEGYKRTKQRHQLMAEQIALLEKANQEERNKKKKNEEKIRENERKQRELAREIAEETDNILNKHLGGDAIQLAQKLGDALFDAFARGEDAALAFGRTVDDIVRNMLRSLLIEKFLEEPLRKAIDAFKKKALEEGDGDLSTDALIDASGDLKKALEEAKGDAEAMGEAYKALLEQMGINPDDPSGGRSDRRADRKGLAAASQESIDELSGRATAIQTHTAQIAQETARLVSFSASTLEVVADIARLVREGNATTRRIEVHTASISKRMRDFEANGIKTKM